jgi:2-hydroxychromene-2-carboxylate isomerase
MSRQIDYYFSLQSPWAYIGHRLFREVVNTYDLKVTHKPVVLVDLFSETGGLPLLKRHPFLRRAFAAVWEDQLDLADPAALVKLADDSGLPGKQLVNRSGSDEIGKIYEQNRQEALAADVFGSPAYVLDGEVFWGQDRIELLVDALKSGRAPYRSRV